MQSYRKMEQIHKQSTGISARGQDIFVLLSK